MRVLHIPTGGVTTDGITKFIIDNMDEIQKTNKIEWSLVSPEFIGKNIEEIVRKNNIDLTIIAGRKNNPLRYFMKLVNYIRSKKFDIVHVHGSSALMSIELLAAKISGVKVRIAHSHNTSCDQKKLHIMLYPIFQKLKTDSLACGQDAGKWLFRSNTFTVIYNGRDIKKFSFSRDKRNKIRKQLCIASNDVLYGHVGHFNNQKNQNFLIDVFNQISKKDKNVKLVLIGTGPLEEEIKEKVKKYNLDERVLFLQNISNIDEYYSAMDIFLFPSIYEGFPLVLIETQSNGLPSFVSNNVTHEVQLTDLINFISLENGPDYWANEIIKDSSIDRRTESVLLTDFDIIETSRKLFEYYKSANAR